MSAETKVNDALAELEQSEDDSIQLLIAVVRKMADCMDPQRYVQLWKWINVDGRFDHLENKE